ncbi:MAG: outer membrane receptor protein involved in Fe transport [Saprospiraceae bacterium]|jgi:outer membrane receptor protein involved in Fe transport
MRFLLTIGFLVTYLASFAQDASVKGQLKDVEGNEVIFANIALYKAADSSLIKVETSDDAGIFKLQNLPSGKYFLSATYIGLEDLRKENIELKAAQQLDLGIVTFQPSAINLAEATVKADRVMVEVKADRTVFNVEGTINSTGNDAVELLRKAPGVTVDNNDNISVLGRSGVLLFVDGKRLPLAGEDLSNYLKNLPADQIDKIDIITNPGARYEAEGNAGIIDIRLKKDKSHGTNGTIRGTYSQGRYANENLNASLNSRNKRMNIFATAGLGSAERFNDMLFRNFQNGLDLDEINNTKSQNRNVNYRIGTDFFINDKNTIGFLYTGGRGENESSGYNQIAISLVDQAVDSVLVAASESNSSNNRNTFNINYRYDDRKTGRSLNIDLDYGNYFNDKNSYLPNQYYDATISKLLSEVNNDIESVSDIDIYTAKLDYEQNLFGGKIGIGGKFSKVVSDNTFLFSDEEGTTMIQNDTFSNAFVYDESVYAGYINYNRKLSKKISISAGVRAEQTDAVGDLQAFLPELAEEPVLLNYIQFFPSAGLSWQIKPMHSLNFNYGRRINRPDYNVLNPFNYRLSELSSRRGNPRLNPEIVNNFEIGYTMKYRYNFKIAYSKTLDQITRLIAPNTDDLRASFITWANLAEQEIFSANISAPVDITDFWNTYVNVSASYIDNQATYPDGGIVDVQAFTYSFYIQNTFNLPAKIKGEISGYFSGPGVWGGVFKYESNWSLNLGLQRKFLEDKLNVRLSANDIFYQSGWDGQSEFNGLVAIGSGRYDSRRVSISVGYNFGNQNVKSRKRKTGLEDEAGRVGK